MISYSNRNMQNGTKRNGSVSPSRCNGPSAPAPVCRDATRRADSARYRKAAQTFGDTTVGVTVYQLHGKRPAQLTQDGNLLQIQCIVFRVAGLNRRAHEYAALGIMLQNGLNGPTGTARHGVDIYFIERLPLRASSALPKLRSFVPIENTKTSGAG